MLALVALFVFTADLLIQRAVSAAIARDSVREVAHLADLLSEQPGLTDAWLWQGPLPAELPPSEAPHFPAIEIHGFDVDGHPVSPGTTEFGRVDPSTLSAVATGDAPVVTLVERPPGMSPQAVAYLPQRDRAGSLTGIVGLVATQAAGHDALLRTVRILGIGLATLCASLLLVVAFHLQWLAPRQHRQASGKTDALTNVFNRLALHEALEAALDPKGAGPPTVGLLSVDIDRLHVLNDAAGTQAGDDYLRAVAGCLTARLRAGDTVGRVAGDRFVAVVPGATTTGLAALAAGLQAAMRRDMPGVAGPAAATVSIGHYVARVGQSAPEALRRATLALRQAKAQGRGGVAAHRPSLDAQDRRRQAVERALHGAWESGRMELYFQPIVAAADARVVGFEALLRMRDENGAPISPTEFIPAAERSGQIHDIGMEALVRAIRIATDWPADRFVSVNLSPAQFRRSDLVERVAACLESTGFPPSRLELEVTESLLIGDEERVTDHLVGLKALGLSLALDDFGTGYSSLSYLFRFSFDKLKIDRVFLEGYSFESPKHAEIIEIIGLLGRKLGMTVVAEGVETEAQREMLARLDCDQMQGFLFGKPVSAAEALRMMVQAPRPYPPVRVRAV
ncbi:putative bifunctional diguanylate cyclase/phosphodiesterase [Jannaschia seohaensis]|nr:bifunctional diguanylate cyclase/phosphodiesterase [Jannaschia seohaensis]